MVPVAGLVVAGGGGEVPRPERSLTLQDWWWDRLGGELIERLRLVFVAVLVGIAVFPLLVTRAEGHHRPGHDGGPPRTTSTTNIDATTLPPTTLVPTTLPPTTLPTPTSTVSPTIPPPTLPPTTPAPTTTEAPTTTTTRAPDPAPPPTNETTTTVAAVAGSRPRRSGPASIVPSPPPLVPDRGVGVDAPLPAPANPLEEVPEIAAAEVGRGELPDYPPPLADLGLIEFWYNLPPWIQALVGAGSTAVVVWMLVTASFVVGGSSLLSHRRKSRR